MSTEEVCQWLDEIALQQYIPAFRAHNCNGEELARLDDETLIETYGVNDIRESFV